MFVPKTTLLALLVHGTSAEVLGHHPSDEKTMEHNPALSGGDAVNNRSPGLLRGSAEESGGDESGRLLQGCWGDGTFCDSIEEFPGPGSCEKLLQRWVLLARSHVLCLRPDALLGNKHALHGRHYMQQLLQRVPLGVGVVWRSLQLSIN